MEAQGGGRPVAVEEFQAPMGAHGPCPVLSGTCPPATEGTHMAVCSPCGRQARFGGGQLEAVGPLPTRLPGTPPSKRLCGLAGPQEAK